MALTSGKRLRPKLWGWNRRCGALADRERRTSGTTKPNLTPFASLTPFSSSCCQLAVDLADMGMQRLHAFAYGKSFADRFLLG